MNSATVQTLIALNNCFYAQEAESFSATRQAPWPGWSCCLEFLQAAGLPRQATEGLLHNELTLLDVACGNLRFERFCTAALPHTRLIAYAVDNSQQLLALAGPADASPQQANVERQQQQQANAERRQPADASGQPGSQGQAGALELHVQRLDLLEALQKGQRLADVLAAPKVDLAACFGFLHHVPTARYRTTLLEGLARKVKPGGYLIVSFWQFLTHHRLAAKAQETHRQALEACGLDGPDCLDLGDFLLGWQGKQGAYRYCHSFSADDIEGLIAALSNQAGLVHRFECDGRNNRLNTYLIFRVH